MKQAQFMNRGEQFFVIDESTRYHGECVWSPVDVPGEGLRPAYPVRIFVKSIRRCGLAGLFPLSQSKRLSIAKLAKELLVSSEQGCSIELLEDY
jgi:hypothetical protein